MLCYMISILEMEMYFVLKILLVVIVVRRVSTASHQYYRNVVRKMSAAFGHALYACEKAIPITNGLLTEFYFYWDKKHPLTKILGCAVTCMSWKMGLMTKQGWPHETNIKRFIRRHGGDEYMIYRFKELTFDCTQVIKKKRFKNTCITALEIAKCFRIGISYYHWAPKLSDIYYDMTKTISRRNSNGSDDKFNQTEIPKLSSVHFESYYNVTTPDSNNSRNVIITKTKPNTTVTNVIRNSSIHFKTSHDITKPASIKNYVFNNIVKKVYTTVSLNTKDVKYTQPITPVVLLSNKIKENGSDSIGKTNDTVKLITEMNSYKIDTKATINNFHNVTKPESVKIHYFNTTDQKTYSTVKHIQPITPVALLGSESKSPNPITEVNTSNKSVTKATKNNLKVTNPGSVENYFFNNSNEKTHSVVSINTKNVQYMQPVAHVALLFNETKEHYITNVTVKPITEVKRVWNKTVIKATKQGFHNITDPRSIGSHFFNNTDKNTYPTVSINTRDIKYTQPATPVAFSTSENIEEYKSNGTVELITEVNKTWNKRDFKATKNDSSLDIYVNINLNNEMKIDTSYLKYIIDRFEKRARKRDLKLIKLYRDSLSIIRNHLSRLKRHKKGRRISLVGMLNTMHALGPII